MGARCGLGCGPRRPAAGNVLAARPAGSFAAAPGRPRGRSAGEHQHHYRLRTLVFIADALSVSAARASEYSLIAWLSAASAGPPWRVGLAQLVPYRGWLVKGSAAGRWYGPAPHASRALRVPAGPAQRRPLTRGSLPVLGRGNCGQGGARPADRAPPPRPGEWLTSGGYRGGLDRVRDRRRGCAAGKVASFVGAARVGPLMSRVDLVRGLPRLGPRCRRPPLPAAGLRLRRRARTSSGTVQRSAMIALGRGRSTGLPSVSQTT